MARYTKSQILYYRGCFQNFIQSAWEFYSRHDYFNAYKCYSWVDSMVMLHPYYEEYADSESAKVFKFLQTVDFPDLIYKEFVELQAEVKNNDY